MTNKVIKRDGRVVEFNWQRIQNAICSAMERTDAGRDADLAMKISEKVMSKCDKLDHDVSVEEIQDMVENALMASSRKDAAREYIIYREKRSRARNRKSKLSKVIGEKITAANVQNQNANVDEMSFGGRRGQAASAVLRQYALDNMLSDMARENHINNRIYIHDFDSYPLGLHNCLTVPFDDLLANGFTTRQTDVRPANSINTAFQLLAVLFQLQSLQQFG